MASVLLIILLNSLLLQQVMPMGTSELYTYVVPYMSSLMRNKVHACVATVLNYQSLLTSALCVYDPTPVDVTANTTKCHTVTGRVPRYQVITRFLHPRFNKFSLVGDLAVIHVEVDLKAKGAVPVPLLDRSLEVGESVKVFGWNIDFVPGYKEESLYLSKTKVIDPQICVRHYGSRFVVGEMLCMDMWKYKETTTEPVGCEMDTASVAVLEVDGKRYVGALALFAGGCMYEGWPEVYLNTFPYNAWIKSKLA